MSNRDNYADHNRNQLYRLLHAQEQSRQDAEYNLVRAKRLQAEAKASIAEADRAIADTKAQLELMGERL